MEQENDKVAGENGNQPVLDNTSETEVAENQSGQGAGDTAAGNEKMAAELKEAKDKYLRLYADFENFRRRTAKEKVEFVSTAQGELMKALLPVLDDFERGLKASAKAQDGSAAREGMELIYHKLYRTLEQKGLKPMEATGTPFDPELHEAITQVPAPQEDLKGKVVDEVEKGYYLQDKVLRFAKVIVGA
jgi:molecular chaperone GrpE